MRTLKWVYKEEFPPTNLPFLSPSTTSSDLKQTHTHTHKTLQTTIRNGDRQGKLFILPLLLIVGDTLI
jgi:hypothetical protein